MGKRQWRLLPDTDYLGWTPYVWLVYLGLFVFEPASRLKTGGITMLEVVAVALATIVFLVSYFRGFWATGRELQGIVALHCALGVIFAPVTWGASVFFVYAASFAGNIDPARLSARVIIAIAIVSGLTFWLIDTPVRYVLPSVGMPLLVGFVNLHYAEVRRGNARLQIAQAQIERLATVAERERIARDLHDVLGHTLSLIVLKSELARKLVARDPARAAQEIEDVETVSRQALRDVRDAIRGYHASLTEEVDRARTLLQAAAINAEFDVQIASAPRRHEETLALALREAITNVVRHSGAHTCCVQLRANGRDCILLVEDDGTMSGAAEGTGLRGMRERVEAAGGTVVRGASPITHGLRLEVRVPLDDVNDDARADTGPDTRTPSLVA